MKHHFYPRFYSCYRFINTILRPFRWMGRKMGRTHLELVREALRFEPWDWAYTLDLEKKALQCQLEQFEKYGNHVDAWIDARDIRWCIDLIDIITERTGLVEYNRFARGHWVFNRRVNTKNMSRFTSDDLMMKYWNDNDAILAFRVKDYYINKAWALYCKIRQDRMRNWWD